MGGSLLLVVAALAVFTVPVVLGTAELLRRNLESTASREADLFVPLVLREDADAARSIADRTRDFEEAFDARVRLVRAEDSPGAATGDRQVEEALAGEVPEPVWGMHPLLGERAVSVVVPVRRDGDPDGEVVAAVQVVAPAAEIDREVRETWTLALVLGGVVVLVAAAGAFGLASGLTRSLVRLGAVARRHGEGDYASTAPEQGPPEVTLLARTLNRSAQQTSALLDSQRSFVADASHQLRTPLAAMRLTLDTVRETVRGSGDPAVERRLGAVDREIQRMDQLVNGLLTMARAEAAGGQRSRADLGALVDDRALTWQAAMEEANVELVVDSEGVMTVEVTDGAVEQVLDNLLDNAVSVSPPGARITVRCAYAPGGGVVLSVADQGPGLAPAERARAFDRFWTTRPGEGSGLGLAVVRRLVERDGGEVALDPGPKDGLVVRVQWPEPWG